MSSAWNANSLASTGEKCADLFLRLIKNVTEKWRKSDTFYAPVSKNGMSAMHVRSCDRNSTSCYTNICY